MKYGTISMVADVSIVKLVFEVYIHKRGEVCEISYKFAVLLEALHIPVYVFCPEFKNDIN